MFSEEVAYTQLPNVRKSNFYAHWDNTNILTYLPH